MSRAKCSDADYIDFLIATPQAASCREAARSGPDGPAPAAHDAYTRLLHRLEPDPEILWSEVEPLVRKNDGVLILDDSTLDKFYALPAKPFALIAAGPSTGSYLSRKSYEVSRRSLGTIGCP